MMLPALRHWPVRRWLVTALAAAGFVVLVGVPTDLIDTPLFSRDVPPTWWAWPALVVSAVLAGMLTATYVRSPASESTAFRGGWIGGVLTLFAVGCPVCNKLVLLAIGTAGALNWFQPVQPLLQAFAVGLLAWALVRRLASEAACAMPGARGGSRV